MRRNKEYNVLVGGSCFIILVVLIFIAIISNAFGQQKLEIELDAPDGVFVTSNGEDEFTIQLAQATVNVKIKVNSVTSVVPTPAPPTPTPTPSPSPTPTAEPTPAPTATPSPVVCNSTISAGANVQNAINAASSGQTVCLNAGTYSITGQLLMKTNVRLYCHEGAILDGNQGSEVGPRFNSNVSGATIQNCEIKEMYNGVRIGGSNNFVLDNNIHSSAYQGVLQTAGSGNVIAGNTIHDNGDVCTSTAWGGYSPRHCHAVYFSNPSGFCSNQVGNIVRNNYLGPEGGVGVNFNGQPCPSHKIDQTLIENNQIVDVNSGVALWYGTSNTIIRDNDFVIQNPPTSNMPNSLKYAVTLWGGGGLTRTGNTYSLMSGYGEFATYQ